MSISLIVGKPGDGKSYAAVHMCILPALQQGRSVFTNIPINVELARIELSLREDQYINVVDKEKLEKEDLFKIPGGTLIVLDEVWRYWKKEERKPETEDEKFFAEHRHKVGRMPGIDGMLSQDIVLITQNTAEIPTWIKGRIASTYKVVKLTAAGIENRFRVDVYRGAQGERPQKDSFISASLGRYSADVWRYYQSHTLGDTSGGISAGTLEPGPSASVSVWQNPKLRLYFALFGLCLVFVGYRLYSTGGAIFSAAAKASQPVSTKPIKSRSPDSVPSDPVISSPDKMIVKDDVHTLENPKIPLLPVETANTGPFNSPDWWISGVIHYSGNHLMMITNGSKTRKIKIDENDCNIEIEKRCVYENIAYYNIPLGPKSLLPGSVQIPIGEGGALQREPASIAGAPPMPKR